MKICHNRMSRGAMAALFLLIATNAYGQLQWSDQVFTQTLPQFERSIADQSRIEIPDGQASFGGGIVGQVGTDGLLTIFGSGQALVGVEFISENGLLVPVPSGADGTTDASPFQLLLSNTENQVTYGTLGDAVVIDGGVKLGVGYTGQFPLDDISAQWGRDTDAIEFPVGRQGVPFTTPFNLGPDGAPVNYSQAVFQATIEAGSATGSPSDTPADRVDPNDGSAMFAGVGSLEIVHPTLGSFVCTGTVIDDTHVLTAAHCFDYDADGLADTDITVDSKFFLNDGGSPSATISISSVDIHPDFGGFTASGANDDLAVVTLDSVVPSGTTKYALRNTGMTSGEIVEMVGYGVSGQGDVGGFEILPDLSVKRSGKNTAELFVEDDEGSGELEIFIYDFDGPTGDGFLGGGTLGNDVETVVRGGDSGGPTFVDEGGMKVIAGVNTFEFVLEPTTPGTGEFGVLGGGVIIGEAQFDWISSIATGAVLVPEPTSATLMMTMLSAVFMVRRRRR